MAITGPSSFPQTTQDFIDHWEQANIERGAAGPIELPGAPLGWPAVVNMSTLVGLLDALDTKITEVASRINGVETARGALVAEQQKMLGWLGQFNGKVRAMLGGTKWVDALALAPSIGDAQSRFIDPLEDMEDLWERINTEQALGVGVVLKLIVDLSATPQVEMTQAQFAAKIAPFREVWRAVGKAELMLKLARGKRNEVQERIYPILRQYRVVVPTYFPAGSAIVLSLPRLTPEPGTTPEPAVVTWAWNGTTHKAEVSAAIPVQSGLKKARLFYSPGVVWDEEGASQVMWLSLEGVDLNNPVVFETDFALSVPGSHALFRVVVENETNNEASSNVVDVVRP